jgi:GTP-binding protein EngB required for normal cell division
MRDRLADLAETADLAIASCGGVLAAAELEPVKTTAGALRARLAYPEDILVVALAGGTGSGKSSLFNALIGEEVADVGGVRPTTSHPRAAVPGTARESLEGYLDYLGTDRRHVYDGETICVIDLPDSDSVETQHRHRVDAMLPLVDVVVWVTDPEKYRDARLHREYLQPMAMYSSQFVCVLNQVDRLAEDQRESVLVDLSRALTEDGLEGVPVVATSVPMGGPPVGIDELSEELELKRGHRVALYGKLLTDLEVVTHQLESMLAGTADFDDAASSTIESAVESLMSGDSPVAIETLVSFLDTLARETGGVTGDSLRLLAGNVPAHVIGITRTSPEPTRLRLFRRQIAPDPGELRARLSETVMRPARALIAKRALARATVAELAVSTATLRTTTTG